MQLSISNLSCSGRKLLSKKNPVLDKSDPTSCESGLPNPAPFHTESANLGNDKHLIWCG
jgi:hypothetical protein